jgi:hypothetical protein
VVSAVAVPHTVSVVPNIVQLLLLFIRLQSTLIVIAVSMDVVLALAARRSDSEYRIAKDEYINVFLLFSCGSSASHCGGIISQVTVVSNCRVSGCGAGLCCSTYGQ